MAYISGGGICLKWFLDAILRGEKGCQELDVLAEEVLRGSAGLIFTTHFSGLVCPNDGAIKSNWLWLAMRHDYRYLYRAIVEGLAYEYKMYLDIIQESVLLEGRLACSVGRRRSPERLDESNQGGCPLAAGPHAGKSGYRGLGMWCDRRLWRRTL